MASLSPDVLDSVRRWPTGAKVAAIGVGAALFLFPEPVTSLLGLAIVGAVAATWLLS